ncbi:MAG: alpha/beta hydrolase [Oscillospiraceae bacterium]|nr:alpha/beta hydrolase [Oscillospiraceae bacterium]
MVSIWDGPIPGYDEGCGKANPQNAGGICVLAPYLLDGGPAGSDGGSVGAPVPGGARSAAVGGGASGSGARPCAIVFPGGGYQVRAPHEGAPISIWLNGIGLSSFVLHYRVAPYRHPHPLMDAKRAVRHVRANAAAYGVDPNRIGVVGFSAGGHLASSAGTLYEGGDAGSPDPVERVSSRPDFMVLCYPVITMGHYTNPGSRDNLIGPESRDPMLEALLSGETQVTGDTPPTFMWHTADDAAVPAENCLLMAGALSRAKVPYELHIYAEGPHGVGLAAGDPYLSTWAPLCGAWMAKMGII